VRADERATVARPFPEGIGASIPVAVEGNNTGEPPESGFLRNDSDRYFLPENCGFARNCKFAFDPRTSVACLSQHQAK
jgi:hypothetical protein